MEAYIVTFSIEINENLKKVYDKVVESIKKLGTEGIWEKGSVLEINKTTFLVYSHRSRDSIRKLLEDTLEKNQSDGDVLVIEIKSSGWSCHFIGDYAAEKKIKWIKKYVSGEE